MEFRKLIKSGQTSFTVSLPISWIKKHELKKQDIIGIVEQGDALVLSPSPIRDNVAISEVVIDADTTPPATLELDIQRAYVDGTSIIWIKSTNIGRLQDRLRFTFSKFPGLEFEEKKPDMVGYKNYFDVQGSSIDQMLQKEKLLVKTTFNEIEILLLHPRTTNIASIMEYLDALQKQHLLIAHKILQQRTLTKIQVAALLLSSDLQRIGSSIKDFLTTSRFVESITNVGGIQNQFRQLKTQAMLFFEQESKDQLLLIQTQKSHIKSLARQARSVQDCVVFETLADVSEAIENYARTATLYR